MRKLGLAIVSTALIVLVTPTLLASGGRPSGSPRVDAPQLTPQQKAVQHYNRGLKNRDKAWKHEEKAEKQSNESKRSKELEKAQKQFHKAIKEFRSATSLVPTFHQAYSSLGYALRRTGQFEDSLQAYNRALGLHPGYVEAIEYRAEAYLGLNRLDEVKVAYLQLVRQDAEQAGKLMEAMKAWVGERREDNKVDAATVEEFAKWVAERDSIATTTSSVERRGSW